MIQNQPRTSEEIAARLKKWTDDIDALILLFTEGRVAASNVQEAQDRLRALKEELEGEYRRMDTTKGKAELSQLASAFYWPAVQDAWANSEISGVRWNSRPNHKWSDVLYSVRDYMSHWANQLSTRPEQEE